MPAEFQIKTLRTLVLAAADRRSVVAPSTTMLRTPKPAAFVLYMQARIVANLLERGLYIYKKPEESLQSTTTTKGGDQYGQTQAKG